MDENHAQQLGRIEAKVDILLGNSRDQDSRIRSVERRQWWAAGGVAIFTGFIMKTQAFAQIIGLH